MQLRWLRVTVGHKDAICLNGECRILQVGYWEATRHTDNGHGQQIPIMEMQWHDIPVESLSGD